MFREQIISLRKNYGSADYITPITLLEEAYNAYMKGNFGISCLIFREEQIIAHGQNRMIFPNFSSALHAEMDAINTLEKEHAKLENVSNLKLYSSLEPCPMCLSRIINSGITDIYYMADDKRGGGVGFLDRMPPIWQELGEKLNIKKMELPDEFEELSKNLAFVNADKIHQIILNRQ